LSQLSFNKQVALDIDKDPVLRPLIDKNLANKPATTETDEFSIYSICKQIDWNIKERKEIKPSEESKPVAEELNKRHVMISYNTGSRPLCLQVKADLEASGYKVWMDVADIHGGSLDSMAKAVEGAAVVLMCVTEKYRASVNCQGEAQYSHRCNKPIVPCIMQQGAESIGGWLGFIMGDKIFVHFMKYEFAECMRRLKAEIDVHYKAVKVRSVNPLPPDNLSQHAATPTKKVSEVVEWSTGQVEDWFKKNEIDLAIYEDMRPCNGKILNQM
jgi:hypothetical protein